MDSCCDKTIFPKGALNPHEPPPLPLKDIFKRYRKLGLTEISKDEAILDLATGRLPDELITLRSTSIEHTSALFAQFLGEDLAHTEQVTYGHKALPGKDFYLVHSSAGPDVCVRAASIAFYNSIAYSEEVVGSSVSRRAFETRTSNKPSSSL
jgi:hypothetical protein